MRRVGSSRPSQADRDSKLSSRLGLVLRRQAESIRLAIIRRSAQWPSRSSCKSGVTVVVPSAFVSENSKSAECREPGTLVEPTFSRSQTPDELQSPGDALRRRTSASGSTFVHEQRRAPEAVAALGDEMNKEASRTIAKAVPASVLRPGVTAVELEAHERLVAEAAKTLTSQYDKFAKDGLAERLKPRRSGDGKGRWSREFAAPELVCTRWRMGDTGICALLALLQACPNLDGSWTVFSALRTLSLRENAMSSQGAIKLAEALLKPRKNADSSWTPASSLEELYLFGNSIGDDGAIALAVALAPQLNCDGSWVCSTEMTTLDLRKNSIGDIGAVALSKALEPKQSVDDSWTITNALEKLHLNNNPIGRIGASALAAALQPRQNKAGHWTPSTRLTDLDLRWTQMGDSCKALITEAAAAHNRHLSDATRRLQVFF